MAGLEGKRDYGSSFWKLHCERKVLTLEDWKTLRNGESWWVDLLSGQDLGGDGMETHFPPLVTGAWGKDAHGGGGNQSSLCLSVHFPMKIFH